jgi:hypothetical protein
MKKIFGVMLFLLLMVFIACGQKKSANVLSDLDKNILLKTDAQIQLIQAKFQKEAAPMMDEQAAVIKRVCAAVGATPGVDCEVNVQNSSVGKKKIPAPSIPTAQGAPTQSSPATNPSTSPSANPSAVENPNPPAPMPRSKKR